MITQKRESREGRRRGGKINTAPLRSALVWTAWLVNRRDPAVYTQICAHWPVWSRFIRLLWRVHVCGLIIYTVLRASWRDGSNKMFGVVGSVNVLGHIELCGACVDDTGLNSVCNSLNPPLPFCIPFLSLWKKNIFSWFVITTFFLLLNQLGWFM